VRVHDPAPHRAVFSGSGMYNNFLNSEVMSFGIQIFICLLMPSCLSGLGWLIMDPTTRYLNLLVVKVMDPTTRYLNLLVVKVM
jgi:hypothetical protein